MSLEEIKVSYNPSVDTKPKVASLNDAYQYFLEIFDKDALSIREECVVLFLNRANRALGFYRLSIGGITGTVVDIRLILGIAVKCLACGIIIAHNHPSGNLKPSKSDILLTERLMISARLMEISLLDHLIISATGYYSFAENGAL